MGSQSSKINQTNSNQYSSDNEKSSLDPATTASSLLSKLHLSQNPNQRLIVSKMETNYHLLNQIPASPEISLDKFARWQNSFEQNPHAQFASTVLSKQHLSTALLSRQALTADKQVFSHTLSVHPTPVTDQKASGRCWIFATCNVARLGIVKKFNLGDFELSESYLFFYDTIEKANYYLENMIHLADEPIDARLVSHLSSSPVGDGGQWEFAAALIEKYGVVPKALYDESYHSSNSHGLKTFLTSKLRDFALELRQIHNEMKERSINTLGKNLEEAKRDATLSARAAKEVMMSKVYHCLAIALGNPPAANSPFKWEYVDTNGKSHSLTSTPLEFYHNHCAGFKASDYISLYNDPRHDYLKSYTVQGQGYVGGSQSFRYVNTSSEVMKDLVIKMIKTDQPVWFGCDVGQMSSTTYGIMDTKLFDYESAFGFAPQLSKSERLQTMDSSPTHAMIITGVHLDSNGQPVRFKVENSWSDTVGDRGFFLMTNDWFDEYVYQIVIPKMNVPTELRKVYENSKPVELPAWDPMASFA